MSTTLAPAAADTPAAPGAAAAPQQQQQQQQQLAGETQLAYLCRNTQACVLRPYCFFVSWQGVLTLAYRGFPAPLAALKQAVPGFYGGLPKESPGSKWPKTSLACLREGKRLTPEQLQRLNELCRQQSGIFQAPGHKRAQSILVSSLSTLVYETRCLERVISRAVVALQLPADCGEAPAEEMARVQAVLDEADDADYWFHASRDGNREAHYRAPALGVTLVHEMNLGQQQQQQQQLAATAAAAAAAAAAAPGGGGDATTSAAAAAASRRASDPSSTRAAVPAGTGSAVKPAPDGAGWSSALPGILSKFREAVEGECPGLYTWFDTGSLHVTVRAIIV